MGEELMSRLYIYRARINRRPSVPLTLAVLPLKILGYLQPKKGCPFPTWPWCPCGIMCALLRVLCVPFCAAVMPFFQRLVLLFFRFEYSNNFLPIGIQIFEWTENCDPLIHSAEKKCKTKISNAKLQNYSPQNSLKLLLPIVNTVAIL